MRQTHRAGFAATGGCVPPTRAPDESIPQIQESLACMDSELPVTQLEPACASPRRFRLGRAVLVVGLSGTALVHPLASLLGRFDWRIDLLTHFREPALAFTLIAASCLVRRHPRIALALGCLAVVQVSSLFRYVGSNPVRPDARSTARLRVLLANVLVDNTRYADLERLIRRERPDIIGLVEVTPEWVAGLAAIRAEYPHRVEAPTGTTGLALWFRERPEVIDPPARSLPGGSPYLHAEFVFAGRRRHLWLVHPYMPLSRRDLPELPALAALPARTSGSRIVIGDMNTTEGSPHFGDFLRASGLRDSRLGFGRQPSWPTDWPYRIAIDHAFVSDELAVVVRRLGPEFGSDHFPLILDLAPAAGRLDATNPPSQSSSSPGESSGRGD
jgi:endonuclease/exonuclease/phosphatase (EEP) superfamily protein YafD